MRGSLLTSTSRAYIIIGAFLYIALIYYWNFPHPYYAALNIFTFATFAIFVWKAPRMKPHKYTVKRLWLTVFFYSLVFVALYLLLSDYYTGNTYIFSEKDARLYEDLSFRIKGLSYKEAIYYITVMGELPYDDWGAPMVMSYILKIIPERPDHGKGAEKRREHLEHSVSHCRMAGAPRPEPEPREACQLRKSD